MKMHISEPYSLVRLVWQNTEELISWPFEGLYKIQLLLQDRMKTKNLRNELALLQLQLCLQLQQNTMVPVRHAKSVKNSTSVFFIPKISTKKHQNWRN